MKNESRDLLVEETVQELSWLFRLDEAFPPKHGGDDEPEKKSWWARLKDKFWHALGFRRNAVASGDREPGIDSPSR